MESLNISVELLRSLAPEAGMDQDEQGGCVWCGGSASGLYSRPVAEDHYDSCPWLAARRLLAASGEEQTMLREVAYDDPALGRILAVSGDPIFAALAQKPNARSTRQDDAMRHRRFRVIENGPDNCLAVIVFELPALRNLPVVISYFFIDPSLIDRGPTPATPILARQLLHSVASDITRMGFADLQIREGVTGINEADIESVLAPLAEVSA